MTQATFTIVINGIKTATINGIADSVKQVDWTLEGELQGQKFDLPQTTRLPDPAENGFIPLVELTPVIISAWIEAHTENIDAIKAHIQYVLDKQVASSVLATVPLPWAPVTTESTATVATASA